VSSTRYTSEPRKDEAKKSVYLPMTAAAAGATAAASVQPSAPEADVTDNDVDAVQMPIVAENDYLLPQSSAAAYVDVVPDNSGAIVSSLLSCSFCNNSLHQ